MELRLDHFKLYEVQAQSAVGHDPTLRGQFDQTAQTVKLLNLRQFANPVSKNGEEIHDPNAHLTVYDFATPVPDPPRFVRLENQFGEQKLVIDLALFLLVPALKVEKGISFPERLDHYKCYRVVKGEPIDKEVSLKDQFDSEETAVLEPIFFGVPTLKRYGGKIEDIKNPKEHLTIYRLKERDFQTTREFKDQFLSGKLEIFRSRALAVPSLKLEWGPA